MKRNLVYLLLVFVFALVASTNAMAQASRTWVSGVGDDANPCSRTAPCKTWAGAISKTAPGGEIDALDPGGFGVVTITKAITLDGGGGINASILASGLNGIIVNAGPNDVVMIRNISINGFNSGLNGIRFLGGKQLIVDHCEIFEFTQNGIDVALNQATPAFVSMRDTILSNNAGDAIRLANAQLPAVQATLSHMSFRNGVNSVEAGVNAVVDVVDSQLNFFGTAALTVTGASSISVINATGNIISNGATGVNPTVTGGVIRLSNNDFFGNTTIAVAAGPGTVVSAGNNHKAGNGAGQQNSTAAIVTF